MDGGLGFKDPTVNVMAAIVLKGFKRRGEKGSMIEVVEFLMGLREHLS